MKLLKKMSTRVARKLIKLLCAGQIGDNNKNASRVLVAAANNRLPPVQFHHVHGSNVRLSNNKYIATRTEGFCKGVVFSSRTIMPNERVYIKLIGVSSLWSGTIRFGFTSEDPASMINSLPKFVCPEMTSAGKTWAKAINDQVARQNSVIHFSYNQNGCINYGINNQDCGMFSANISAVQKLWFVIDIYGNTTGVELIDPRQLGSANACPPLTMPAYVHPIGTHMQISNETVAANHTSIYSAAAPSITSPYKPVPLYQCPTNPTMAPDQAQLSAPRTRGGRRQGRRNAMFMSSASNSRRINADIDNIMAPMMSQQNIYSPSPMAPHNIVAQNTAKNARKPLATVINDINVNNNYNGISKKSATKSSTSATSYRGATSGKPQSCTTHNTTKSAKNNNTSKSKSAINKENSNNKKSSAPRSDCLICFERPIDCVLYQCGHMCTCYQCGVKQWRSQSRTCPICRTVIKDVIKTYMA